MNEQLAGRALDRSATGHEGRDGLQQVIFAVGERPVDLVDELATRVVIAGEGTFDQQGIAADRTGSSRPGGDRAKPGEGRPG